MLAAQRQGCWALRWGGEGINPPWSAFLYILSHHLIFPVRGNGSSEELSNLSKVTQLMSAGIRIQIQLPSGDPRDEGGVWAQGPCSMGLIHSLPSREGLGATGCWLRGERVCGDLWLPTNFRRKRVSQNSHIFPEDQEIRSHCNKKNY